MVLLPKFQYLLFLNNSNDCLRLECSSLLDILEYRKLVLEL